LGRALRPLKRRKDSRHQQVIDEPRTAQHIAETKLWMPTMRPKQVRWMDLALVVDSDESSELWQQTIYELRKLLTELGAFRAIHLWFLSTSNHGDETVRITKSTLFSPARSSREAIDPCRGRMFIIFSDCVGPRWQSASLQELLRKWAESGPVAIV